MKTQPGAAEVQRKYYRRSFQHGYQRGKLLVAAPRTQRHPIAVVKEVSMTLLTEQRPVADLIVYGYLRPGYGTARLRALKQVLADYCERHELKLCGVFTEPPDSDVRHATAFAGLLDVLRLPTTYGVVLPARSHLGPRRIALEREHQITTCGARLIAVREPPKLAAARTD